MIERRNVEGDLGVRFDDPDFFDVIYKFGQHDSGDIGDET